MHSFVNKTTGTEYAKLIRSSQFYNKINKTHRFSDAIFECEHRTTEIPAKNWPTCSETLKRFNEAPQRFIEALTNLTRSGSLIGNRSVIQVNPKLHS